MERKTITVLGMVFDLVIHSIDGEVSEVYASHNGMEIEVAGDMDEMTDKLTQYATRWS
jgi:hypothetical protein